MQITIHTADRVRLLIANHMTLEFEDVQPSTRLDALGADSLDLVEIPVALETEFDVALDDADVESLETVQHVIDLVIRKIASAA